MRNVFGFTPTQREHLIEQMDRVYAIVVNAGECNGEIVLIPETASNEVVTAMRGVFGDHTDDRSMYQIYEEINGNGFYRPAKEDWYESIIRRGITHD